MTEPVLGRVAAARSFLSKLWKLSAPYWWAEEVVELHLGRFSIRMREKWIARGLLLVILFLNVFIVYVNKLFNDWYGRFYNALQVKDAGVFWTEIRIFSLLAFLYIAIFVYRTYLRQLLTIRWRRWLTEIYRRNWLGDRTYYRMELSGHGADNPEQRIEQDINRFADQTSHLVLDLISEIMTLVTFSVILWNLSGSITLPVLGGIEIPGYMMWVAIMYALFGSWLTYKVGRPLIAVAFNLERYNADFRYQMTRIRENAESIALYRGEPDEERRLSSAFARIFATWWNYMKYTKRVTALTAFYTQGVIIFPFLVAAPRYFAGQIDLGVVMQISSAFQQVQNSLSWFVNSYTQLADWKATVDRLTTFSETMERVQRSTRPEGAFEVQPHPQPSLVLQDVQVALPNGRVLLDDVDLTIEQGQRLVIQGPSGSGKTTLFRVLAGLWPFGRGRLRLPGGAKVLFLPQKPYIPIGTLREALCYPDKPEAHDLAEVTEALIACQLAHLADRLDEIGNWSLVLSPGEQQRLSFARTLLVRPDWLFLDEATSALDEATETRMYELVAERLPAATVVSIAHKPSVLRFHDARLLLDPDQRQVRLSRLASSAAPG